MNTKTENRKLAAVFVAAIAFLIAVADLGTSFVQAERVTADIAHTPSDANIAAIVSVAGNLDIAYGKIALAKSKDKRVLEFAERMVKDHSAIQMGAEQLLGKLGVTPVDDHTSRGLAENGEKIKSRLNQLNGEEFDRFYIDNEVSYHELVVDATANLLIPNAKNAELRSTLESVLPLFKRHLKHARMIQTEMGPRGEKTGTISDANIAAIVTVAGGLDISYGKIAMRKSKNKLVKEFAERMVTDHTAVQKAVDQLASKLRLVPVENETSKGLSANGLLVREKLNTLKGAEFDNFYIENEVAYHQLVVNATRDLLITSASNPELKAALVQTLPLFERHLEHARSIQEQMNKSSKASYSPMTH